MGAPTSRTNWEIAMRDWRAASIYVNFVSVAAPTGAGEAIDWVMQFTFKVKEGGMWEP
jgi:hypothetical protein